MTLPLMQCHLPIGGTTTPEGPDNRPRPVHLLLSVALSVLASSCSKQTPPSKQRVPLSVSELEAARSLAPKGTAIYLREGKLIQQQPGDKQQGIEAIDEDIEWCVVDNVARVLWFTSATSLYALDIDDSSLHLVVGPVEHGIQDVLIDHGSAGRLGGLDPVSPTLWLAVSLSGEPVLTSVLGCQGDGSWYCYEDFTDGPVASWPLQKEFRERQARLDSLDFTDRAFVDLLAARPNSTSVPKAPNAIAVGSVKAAQIAPNCDENPEDCGRAFAVSDGYWRVIVGNARGDYYHQYEQLYDVEQAAFINIETGARSQSPTSDSSLEGLWVSPDGTQALTHNNLFSFASGLGPSYTQACGWVGGGFRIPGPNDGDYLAL